jgi:hypothetical protein
MSAVPSRWPVGTACGAAYRGRVTDPYDDPDWAPWDVESARRWALPPVPGVPGSANWCSACDRLERSREPLHNTGTADPLDPPRPCPAQTIHAVTVVPVEPAGVASGPPRAPFSGFWCSQCRYLVPSASEPHPDEGSRPSRSAGCVQARIYRVRVERPS